MNTVLRVVVCLTTLLPALWAQDLHHGSDIAAGLRQMSLDPDQTFRVREVQLSRGDIKIYLTEGILSFVTPVAGRVVAAIFTTEGVEAGDAEILVLPPQRSERASLASFTSSPNLDEHFTSALFLFSDETAKELLAQINDRPIRRAPEVATRIAPILNPVVRDASSRIDVRVVRALLDKHNPAQGFFYSLIAGRTLGTFDVMYEPTDFEPISLGRAPPVNASQQEFQLWTEFRPRHAPRYLLPPVSITDYQIDATIRPDLSMSATAAFKLRAAAEEGRTLEFALSERLKVLSASINGAPAEVFQRDAARVTGLQSPGTFLLISGAPLTGGAEYRIQIRYEGSVIRQTGDGSYFVDERNAWYPHRSPMLTTFDLTFHYPSHLRLVSTGELVSEDLAGDTRVVHRKTPVPEALAGFNLGDYKVTTDDRGPYRIECYSNRAATEGLEPIPQETESILAYYTQAWMQLPIRSVAVSPIPGYFGQGFPGLIYLSSVSYLREEERPAQLRNPAMDHFFSELLLPHEVAHQWWGNIVSAADYRTGWLVEAMANYSALRYLQKSHGAATVHAALGRYRADLTHEENGKTVESAGPVDFGPRLLETASMRVWHTITYEKGTWILQMLHQRLGEEGFNKLQMRMLHEFASKPISNDDFRKIASDLVPAGQSDKSLALFFDTWVYGTGIPKIVLRHNGQNTSLDLSGVDEDFTADVPLTCRSEEGKAQVRWIRASAGTNALDMAGCELPSLNDFLYSP